MKRRGKVVILGILFIVALVTLILLLCNKLYSYSIIAGTVTLILFVVFIIVCFNSRDEESVYKSNLNKLLKTYDSILVKSSTLPSLDDRNIIQVESFQDLINAQLEIRKPIYYKLQVSCCSFLLRDDKEACTYILKSNDNVVSDLDILINEKNIVDKKKEKDDYSILKNIDKTSIIMLDNSKSFKVSPIREKKKDDIEIL